MKPRSLLMAALFTSDFVLLFDQSFNSPQENLACDEALLEACESGEVVSGVLRFWESPSYFVVLGYTGKVEIEANIAACRERAIPIFRRCSGGGTVLQGPHCLNYSLVFPIEPGESLTGITVTNQFVMERNAHALSRVLGAPVEVRGHSDLTLGNHKFSGNAQRRKRNFFLFHGTFLLGFDLELMAEVLRQPPVQPEYRGQRTHGDFVINLDVSAAEIKQSLAQEWGVDGTLHAPPLEHMTRLIEERYSRDEWNMKF